MTAERIYTLTALTDIWTGDADGKPGRLITTGLLGSIRWWFEVLVRGLRGSACDPTNADDRCPDNRKNPHEHGHHCVVCELFGCTGWARKFRFDVLDENDQPKQTQIKKGETFKLRFTELRSIRDEEWALLDLTIRLIAEYGAIGGKTVYKPTEEANRVKQTHHRDYGLIKIEEAPRVARKTLEQLKGYAGGSSWRKPNHGAAAWASLEYFWCVKDRYLARQNSQNSTFNRVIGRPEPKANASDDRYDSWLAGRRARGGDNPQPAESKKVFSFKEEKAARTFGFAESQAQLDGVAGAVQKQLSKQWPGFDCKSLKKGTDILPNLIAGRSSGE